MYDLGVEHDLRAVRLTTYKFGILPPDPPPPPAPSTPPLSPPPPSTPPLVPLPSAPPASPFPFICMASIGTSDCYDKLVLRAHNGICEDGGEGSTSDVCAWGHAKMQVELHTHASKGLLNSPTCLPLRVRKKTEPITATAPIVATRTATGTPCRARKCGRL